MRSFAVELLDKGIELGLLSETRGKLRIVAGRPEVYKANSTSKVLQVCQE